MKISIPVVLLLISFPFKTSGQTIPAVPWPNDSTATEQYRNDLKKFYEKYNVNGLFVLYSTKQKKYVFYNKSLYHQEASPASTFNIVNALVALEEGTISGQNSLMKWNGKLYANPLARRDLDLTTAFKYNIDWYFWRLRLKTGAQKMKSWVNRLQYGNMNVPATIDSFRVTPLGTDSFWVVSGTLRITPAQQLQFIRRLYYEQLPFSKRTITIVKKLMFDTDTSGYRIYGKRGSYRLNGENKYIGWFVGYAETRNDTYFFVNYIETPDVNHTRIVDAQKRIVYEILQHLHSGK